MGALSGGRRKVERTVTRVDELKKINSCVPRIGGIFFQGLLVLRIGVDSQAKVCRVGKPEAPGQAQ